MVGAGWASAGREVAVEDDSEVGPARGLWVQLQPAQDAAGDQFALAVTDAVYEDRTGM
jgi:hypothetical protein